GGPRLPGTDCEGPRSRRCCCGCSCCCAAGGGEVNPADCATAGPAAPPPPHCPRKRSAGERGQAGSPVKKPRREVEDPPPPPPPDEQEDMDTGNVASLISIFGSSFSGLLSKEPKGRRRAPLDGSETTPTPAEAAAEPGQICCDEPVLRTLNPWSTAIVAF
ncbi:PREDICTED: immediate early response gene 5 protein, partial [Calidris pugnax]|uniref:immediate early response gene 5 protein n=1 Tax=Calidris pugnax TaxID=198806 RepID=UPI00071E3C8B